MNLIKTKYGLTKESYLNMKQIYKKSEFKESIFRELEYSLAKEIIKECKFPIPEIKANDTVEFEIRAGICTESEYSHINSQLNELKVWKEMFKQNQCLVDRRLEEITIETLLGV